MRNDFDPLYTMLELLQAMVNLDEQCNSILVGNKKPKADKVPSPHEEEEQTGPSLPPNQPLPRRGSFSPGDVPQSQGGRGSAPNRVRKHSLSFSELSRTFHRGMAQASLHSGVFTAVWCWRTRAMASCLIAVV